jgi:hypothetical protein
MDYLTQKRTDAALSVLETWARAGADKAQGAEENSETAHKIVDNALQILRDVFGLQGVEADPPKPRGDIARTNDPNTSKAAAKEITESGLRDYQAGEVLDLVKLYEGRTSQELAQYATNMGHPKLDRYVIARRLPELLSYGFVLKGLPRSCEVTGYMATTWWKGERLGGGS